MPDQIPAVGFTANLPIDDPASLQDVTVDVPELRPRDLLVDVLAVSVNPVDTKVRKGRDPEGGTTVLGFDAAGVVRQVGPDVTLFAPGDEVFYAVDERIVGRKPSSLSWAEAAAMPLTTITAWEALIDKLQLTGTSSGTLLVVGASGGVGSVVLQLAEQFLPKVRVLATSSRPETDEWVLGLGAEATVNHRGDLRAEIEAAAPDGVDWIFSAQSAGQLELYVDVLNPFGQVVAIDDLPSLDVVPLKPKSLSWHWEAMFARPVHQPADMVRQHELLNRAADLLDAGTLRTTLTRTLSPIDAEQLREAHRLIEDGHVIGKIALVRDEE